MTACHVVIPSRYSSSRLPQKPLAFIHGVPMIVHVARRVAAMSGIDDYCVATDHPAIVDVCTQHDIPVVLTQDTHPSGTDRLAEVAALKAWPDTDIVVNVQGDEPLMPEVLVQQVKATLLAQPHCAMATLCEPIADQTQFLNPNMVKVVTTLGRCGSVYGEALYFSRASVPYARDHFASAENCERALRHLGLYAYRVQVLKQYATWSEGVLEQLECLEQLRILEHGQRIAISQAQVSLPPGVDTPEDLERMNALPAHLFVVG